MGVFKEEAHVFEAVAKNQTCIYNDAADYGYPYDVDSPPSEIRDLISAVKGLQELDKKFPEERNLVRNRQEWAGGVSVDVVIFWEQDEGYYCGTKYSIAFNKIESKYSLLDKSCNAFITVDIDRHVEKV
jgi:hypothetical protein